MLVQSVVDRPITISNGVTVRDFVIAPMLRIDDHRKRGCEDAEVCTLSLDNDGNNTYVLYSLSDTRRTLAILYKYARKYGSFGSIKDHDPRCIEGMANYWKKIIDNLWKNVANDTGSPECESH